MEITVFHPSKNKNIFLIILEPAQTEHKIIWLICKNRQRAAKI